MVKTSRIISIRERYVNSTIRFPRAAGDRALHLNEFISSWELISDARAKSKNITTKKEEWQESEKKKTESQEKTFAHIWEVQVARCIGVEIAQWERKGMANRLMFVENRNGGRLCSGNSKTARYRLERVNAVRSLAELCIDDDDEAEIL